MRLSDKFDVDKDIHSWRLTYYYIGKDKDGNNKEQSKHTYHANLKQVAKAVVNYEAGEAKNMDDLVARLDKCEKTMERVLNEQLHI